MGTILITGANGNLGLIVTEKLLADGHSVIALTGRDGAGEIRERKKLYKAEIDLLDEKECQAFIKKSLQAQPGISAAVLLAGGFAMGKLADTDKESLERMIGLNFYTAFNIVRPLLNHFLERPEGGQFILVGSRPGLHAAAGKDFFAYSLSKAMVFKLAEFINAEGKDKGVTATVIVPSTIDTIANRKAMPEADFSKWVPAGNIAEAISFALTETGKMVHDGVMKIYNRS